MQFSTRSSPHQRAKCCNCCTANSWDSSVQGRFLYGSRNYVDKTFVSNYLCVCFIFVTSDAEISPCSISTTYRFDGHPMTTKAMISVDAEPYAYEFEPAHCALVIIDMQRDFLEPGGFGEMLGGSSGKCLTSSCSDGFFQDDHGSYISGTLMINPPGTRHTVRSAVGCIVLAIYEKPVRFLGASE